MGADLLDVLQHHLQQVSKNSKMVKTLRARERRMPSEVLKSRETQRAFGLENPTPGNVWKLGSAVPDELDLLTAKTKRQRAQHRILVPYQAPLFKKAVIRG